MSIYRLAWVAALLLPALGLQADPFAVQGTVRDADHNALSEVKVSVAGAVVATDERGRFSVHLPARPKGTIDFEKPGYKERHLPLPGDSAPMEVSLPANQNNAGLRLERLRLSPSHSLTLVQKLEPKLLQHPLTAAVYRDFVARHGEAPAEEVLVRLYLPPQAGRLGGVFLISEHGMGGRMMEQRAFRDFADRHHFALVGVLGGPIQRGIYPAELLNSILHELGARAGHPELGEVPALVFGHSNGTGFSDLYAALHPERTIGWISYHCGGSWQLKFPGLEGAPGLVLVGQKDALFTDQDAVVHALRRERNAPVALLVEGLAGHFPADRAKMDDLLLAFCETCLRVRAPHGLISPHALAPVRIEDGWLGGDYDRQRGGLQSPPVAAYAQFAGDRAAANWLPDARFASIWQRFMATGSVEMTP